MRDREKQMNDFRSEYATGPDFCKVFEQETKSLYLLAFLLTASHALAERCFLSSLEESLKARTVFKGWVLSWIKRNLTTIAISEVFGESRPAQESHDRWYRGQGEIAVAINAVAKLDTFDRFVFVMSVLDGHSVHECSLLLACSVGQVVEARTRALCALPAHQPVLMSNLLGAPHSLRATA